MLIQYGRSRKIFFLLQLITESKNLTTYALDGSALNCVDKMYYFCVCAVCMLCAVCQQLQLCLLNRLQ